MNLRRLFVTIVLAILCGFTLTAPDHQTAKAHEGRHVGPYTVELGWVVEPAYAGVYNGVEVFISLSEAEHDHDADAASDEHHETEVETIDVSLQVEVSFGGATKVLDLEPIWNDVNHFAAAIIPTRAGDYSFRLTGTIGETEVNETFNSADGEFSSVEPISDILFPEPEASIEGLQNQITQLQTLLAELQAQLAELQDQ